MAAGASETPPGKRESFFYDAKGHRDPFVPLVRDGRLVGKPQPVPTVNAAQPVLYGILWDPAGRSIAMINDTEVRVGDTVAGYRVAEIRQDAVVLSGGGEPLVLSIDFETPSSKSSPRTTMGGEQQ